MKEERKEWDLYEKRKGKDEQKDGRLRVESIEREKAENQKED